MSHITPTRRKIIKHQRGAATLLVTMIFLFITSLVGLYLNRNVLFEVKTSANQMRSTQALEIAQGGLDWVTGMLNSPYDVGPDCSLLSTTNISFRKKYVQTHWGDGTATATNVFPADTTYPGCKVSGTSYSCSCPGVPNATASLGATELPSFTVSFTAIASDPEAVQVTVIGCTALSDIVPSQPQRTVCTPSTASNADGTATVTTILKLRPLLRAAPASPLTCGTSCAVGGSYAIANLDPGSGGILVNAGTAITSGPGTGYTSIPGQPVQNAVVANDPTLSALSSADPTCSNSAMFSAYFGSTIPQYAASPSTKSIPGCDNANTCGSLVDAAYGEGWRSFYFPDGFARNNSSGSLGSPTDPVTIVSASSFNINGNIEVFGMIFANSSNVNDLGTGTADIQGALVTCAGYSNNGNGTLAYNSTVLQGVRRSTGSLVQLSGSWTDRCTLSDANPRVVTCN